MIMLSRLWRIIKYLYYKLLRTEGSAHSIALAVAIGVFVGCIIPIGVWGQTAVSIILAIRFKTNPGITFAATWVSNPYSVIFLYPAFCYVGSRVIGNSMTFAQIKANILCVIHNFSWDVFCGMGAELVLSYIIGAFIFGVVGAGVGYYFTYKIIKKYKQARAKRKTLKIMKKYKKEVVK
jgi:uncharacterized protein